MWWNSKWPLHCKFSGDCNSERIFKIGQYLTKLCVEHLVSLFWPTLYLQPVNLMLRLTVVVITVCACGRWCCTCNLRLGCVRRYLHYQWLHFHLFIKWMCSKETSYHIIRVSSVLMLKQAVVRKHNKPRPRVAHRGIARFLGIDQKCNQVVPRSLHTFPENFMQIGPAVFS